MGGFSLIHGGFLAAGLAVAVPIIIHLLFRQRTRTVAIGSVRFLHQVVREHRRRRRVRQWLLLAMRMFAVLLLALLFARPYLDQSKSRGLEQEIVLLVDNSASMLATDQSGETSLDRAKKEVRRRISKLDDNVVVHIADFNSLRVQKVLIQDLQAISASDAGTDFRLALNWARDILIASDRPQKSIVLISDLQRTGIPKSGIDRLSEDIEIEFANVSEALPRNVAVHSVHPIRTEIRSDGHVTVRVMLKNYGALAVRKLPVALQLEHKTAGKLSARKETDILGYGQSTIDFELPIKRDGLYRGRASIEHQDALALDNVRWLAFEARHPDRVLLIDGQEGRSIFGNETYYLETALGLRIEDSTGIAGAPSTRPLRSFESERIVWEAGEGFPRLEGYRAVVLANVRRLSETDGERLDKYLRGGGNLLVCAGDQVTPDSLVPLSIRGILPGTIPGTTVSGKLRIDRWNKNHPALACFTDPQQGDLRRVEFRKVLPLERMNPDGKKLLEVGQHLVAAEVPFGKGRCLYFGSTIDRDWTELPRTPMYVPFMRQLLAHLTDQLEERSAVVTQRVSVATPRIGIHVAQNDGEHLSVTNLDPIESALDRISVNDLMTLVGGGTKAKSEQEKASRAEIKLPPDSLRPDEVWMYIAWLLLIVLAAETLLSSRVHA